jgi:hypothetical protein
MTQALPHVSLGRSRLVRFLTDLSVANTRVSHHKFTERLAQLIDFADSISLSDAHSRRLDVDTTSVAEFQADITSEFLRARSGIIQQAMRAFFPGSGPSRNRWPGAEPVPPSSASTAAEPYLRFYAAQQADLDARIRGLHLRTRDAVANLSPRLARLCALDTALNEALVAHSRRFFATVPRLLALRLEVLYDTYQAAQTEEVSPPVSWADTREQYRREAQGLLLAEIEARLLPALGLIEALNEET